MDDPFRQMLREWETFYFLAGSSSAALIGLLFVAATLGASIVIPVTAGSAHTWATPVIVHFGSALLLSAIMTVPTLTATSLGSLLGLAAIADLAYLALTGFRLWRQNPIEPVESWDWIWNVIVPAVSHLLVLGTAIGLLANTSQNLNPLALAVALLIAVGIRNTWDLTLWMSQQRRN